ncbi:MAG: hypothetical protein LN569_01735 [Rickettsia endosymbiont of Labidopullus appendiculatus]|nr:hypothetical protein [Rickettsia endosymbiont of Labidopullus appendiculatus]
MKTQYMADDFDDDKRNLLKVRYDKLKEIISAISGNTPIATIASLREQIKALSQLANSAGITLDINSLETSVAVKESEVEFNQDKNIIELHGQGNKELTQEQQERAEHDKEVKSIYEKFDSFHKASLEKDKKYNKHLEKALENIEKGLDIDEDTKKALTKTEKEIEEEKEQWQAIVLTRNKTEEEHKYHSEKIEEINNEIVELKPHKHKEIDTLVDQRKYHDKGLSQAKEKIAQCEVHYKVRDERAKELIKCRENAEQHQNQHNKNIVAECEKAFRERYEAHPKEITKAAIKKEAEQIRQSLTENNKNNNKKKGDSKQATTQSDKTKETNKNNNKTKSNQQWAI